MFLVPRTLTDSELDLTFPYKVKMLTIGEIDLQLEVELNSEKKESEERVTLKSLMQLFIYSSAVDFLLEHTTCTKEELSTLAPTHLDSMVSEVKTINSHFFKGIQRTKDALANMQLQKPDSPSSEKVGAS